MPIDDQRAPIPRRAELHASLGDAARLAIVDELTTSDRSPSELVERLGIAPSLLSFHLQVLERVELVRRVRSSGDARRRYLQLDVTTLALIDPPTRPVPPPDRPIVFVCTRNSARSQLAAALWRHEHGAAATSAGTEPADAVHPGAVAAARRAGFDLGDAVPRRLAPGPSARQIVTVCDRAHEELALPSWHWSIPDPVDAGDDAAFDRAVVMLRDRITHLTPTSQEAR